MRKQTVIIGGVLILLGIVLFLVIFKGQQTPSGGAVEFLENASTLDVLNMAVEQDDPTICEQLDDEDVIDSCKLQYLQLSKGESLSLSDCNIISEGGIKDNCMLQVAINGNLADASACEHINNSFSAKADCYTYAAVSSGDATICENIVPEDSDTMYNFKDNCYTALAYDSGNTNPCSNIQDDENRANCQVRAAVGAGDSAMCGQMGTQNTKDTCYYQFAMVEQDSTLCDIISNNESQAMCSAILSIEGVE